jgi:hypothetical protein
MDDHGYAAVNSEKTIFMKHKYGDGIMHGLFVDDMVHASTSEKLKQDFIDEYKGDFQITCDDSWAWRLSRTRIRSASTSTPTSKTHCRNIRQQSRNS